MSNSSTVADQLGSLSITGNANTLGGGSILFTGTASPPGDSSAAAQTQQIDANAVVEELWHPTPKVTTGAIAEAHYTGLCEQGVIAAQHKLQPLGRVVYILEKNHRVSLSRVMG